MARHASSPRRRPSGKVTAVAVIVVAVLAAATTFVVLETSAHVDFDAPSLGADPPHGLHDVHRSDDHHDDDPSTPARDSTSAR